MHVYLITNRVNGKIYVGSTRRTLEERWYEHCYEAWMWNYKAGSLYGDMKKYGTQKFSVTLLRTCSSLNQLSKLERYYIQKYRACNPQKGYNTLSGGASTVTWKLKKKSSRIQWFLLTAVLLMTALLFLLGLFSDSGITVFRR